MNKIISVLPTTGVELEWQNDEWKGESTSGSVRKLYVVCKTDTIQQATEAIIDLFQHYGFGSVKDTKLKLKKREISCGLAEVSGYKKTEDRINTAGSVITDNPYDELGYLVSISSV